MSLFSHTRRLKYAYINLQRPVVSRRLFAPRISLTDTLAMRGGHEITTCPSRNPVISLDSLSQQLRKYLVFQRVQSASVLIPNSVAYSSSADVLISSDSNSSKPGQPFDPHFNNSPTAMHPPAIRCINLASYHIDWISNPKAVHA